MVAGRPVAVCRSQALNTLAPSRTCISVFPEPVWFSANTTREQRVVLVRIVVPSVRSLQLERPLQVLSGLGQAGIDRNRCAMRFPLA